MRERMIRLAARLGLPLAIGAVMGMTGPFGTYALLPAVPRLIYWLAVISVNWLIADALLRRVDELAQGLLPAPRLLVPLLGAFVAALPATGIVALANGLSGIGWPGNVAVLFAQVLVLMSAISLPVYAWQDMQERMKAPPPSPAELPGTPPDTQHDPSLFFARLPGPVEGRLLCLEMQDHYLVVHASAGSMMILCRMEDATRELAGLGLRVHRSWWAARDAIAGVEREGQRLFLRLVDDRRIPVGRTYHSGLRAAGLL